MFAYFSACAKPGPSQREHPLMTKSDRGDSRLLLVEDSVSFSFCIKAKLEKEIGLEIVLAPTLAEARRAIEVYQGQFFLALLDLNLPDASGDEVVMMATENKIPSIVFTGTCSDQLRERLFHLGAIDYLNKDNPYSINNVASVVKRLRNNRRWSALVVDDSNSQRRQISDLLKSYRFNVLEAESGAQALEILDQTPNMRLVVTDFVMPQMDGCELTKAIRRKYSPEKLAIIGVSAKPSSPLTARFLKNGANDFLIKPFVSEEFFCRMAQNMDHLDHLQALTDAAGSDPLTGLRNRRRFFEMAEALTEQAHEEGAEFSVAMIDIDHFKSINDTYGHLAGDEALIHVANIINGACRDSGDLVARLGGEEFGVFLANTDQETAHHLLEKIRESIELRPFLTSEGSITITASFGLCAAADAPLTEMLALADRALYVAKAAGRNQVVVAEDGGATFFNEYGYVQTG